MSTPFTLGDAHRAVAADPALGLEHLTLNPDCDECERFVQSLEQAAESGSSKHQEEA